jgi:hypothetical protein
MRIPIYIYIYIYGFAHYYFLETQDECLAYVMLYILSVVLELLLVSCRVIETNQPYILFWPHRRASRAALQQHSIEAISRFALKVTSRSCSFKTNAYGHPDASIVFLATIQSIIQIRPDMSSKTNTRSYQSEQSCDVVSKHVV